MLPDSAMLHPGYAYVSIPHVLSGIVASIEAENLYVQHCETADANKRE